MRFVLIFLLYGGIQFYAANKAIHAFGLVWPARLAVFAWAVLMTVGPLLLWRLERCVECHALAVGVAWGVYAWMGLVFIYFWLGLVLDVLGWAARMAGWGMLSADLALYLVFGFALSVWLYGYYSASQPRIERIVIRSDKFPKGFAGLRIVQISDMHLGLLAGRKRLDFVLRQIEALHPDILLSTGDLVDAQAHHLEGLSERFAVFQPRYGKFAVTGNHEHYAGLVEAVNFHTRCGFRVLRNSHVEVAGITLVGVDDPAVLAGPTPEAGLLAGLPGNRFTLLLKHQPLVDPSARFDLQLSGHTHAGQIFPFGLLVQRVYPMIAGRYPLANGGQLYVSRGTGTWGPPIRLFAPAEISLIELLRTD